MGSGQHVAEHLLLRPGPTVAFVPPLTADALHARVVHLTQRLRLACGGELKGCLVALAAPATNACLLEALFAVTAVGAVLAPLNARWSSAEAARSLLRCGGAAVLLLHPDATLDCGALVAQGAVGRILLLHGQPHAGMDGDAWRPHPHRLCASDLVPSPDGTAVVCFTSGTTGASKGAALSHTALWTQSMAKVTALGLTPQDVYMNLAPLFHIGGVSYALAATLAGAVHVFPAPSASFAPAHRLAEIASYQVTVFIAAPVLLEGLVAASASASASLGSVRMIALGAGPATPKLLHEAFATFPTTRIVTAYGMTEASSTIALHEPSRDAAGRMGDKATTRADAPVESGVCVGRPAAHAELAVMRADGRLASRAGEEGEVLTRGHHVMTRYWNDPEETRKSTVADGGWLRTGDVGYLDERGQLWLLGRQKDVIRTGSENVHASEVEAVLTQHPGVRAAAVVGMPHTKLGECVGALLVLQASWVWREASDVAGGPTGSAGADATACGDEPVNVLGPQELRRHCVQSGLSRYKLPRVMIAQAQPLPADTMGKVSKAAVRERLAPTRSRL